MSTDIWLFEEPPRRLSQIERRSCQLLKELEHWLFLPPVSMSQLSKKGARSRALTVIYDLLLARSAGGLYPEEPAMSGRTEGAIDIPVGGASSDASSPPFRTAFRENGTSCQMRTLVSGQLTIVWGVWRRRLQSDVSRL